MTTTLYATIPTQVLTDSLSPFETNDGITATTDGSQLIVTDGAEGDDQ